MIYLIAWAFISTGERQIDIGTSARSSASAALLLQRLVQITDPTVCAGPVAYDRMKDHAYITRVVVCKCIAHAHICLVTSTYCKHVVNLLKRLE